MLNLCLFLGVFLLDTLPVEAKPVWHKQAIELEEEIVVSEEPTWAPTYACMLTKKDSNGIAVISNYLLLLLPAVESSRNYNSTFKIFHSTYIY